MEIFGSSGTRGVANEALTPAFAVRVAKAAGTRWDTDRVAVARDTRTTGPMLAAAVASGLASAGADVERLGIVPTPGVQAYAESEAVPAVMVTASHNPAPYNGIKLIGADGIELTVDALEGIEATFRDEAFASVPWDEVGTVSRVDGANRRYLSALLEAVDRDRIAGADLRVAIDPGHGAGALTTPTFVRELGCEVVTVNAQPDGHFPGRDPEPVRGNLGDLRRLVRTAEADVGIAHDGDADRAIFVDARGEYVEGDAALAALAAAELEEGDVTVAAVNVSQRLLDAADAAGARVELTPIGSTRIMTRIRELRAAGERVPIAGEGNGGIVFPEYRVTRDGAYTAARLLELVAERPVAALAADYDGYHNVRVNVPYETAAERDALDDEIEAYAASAEGAVSRIDGARIDHGDGWVLVRPSGTEPLVRIYAEATDKARADELVGGVRRALEDAKEEA